MAPRLDVDNGPVLSFFASRHSVVVWNRGVLLLRSEPVCELHEPKLEDSPGTEEDLRLLSLQKALSRRCFE